MFDDINVHERLNDLVGRREAIRQERHLARRAVRKVIDFATTRTNATRARGVPKNPTER
jgi:hypothetical protein